jgi:predicted dehydrogenase
MKGGKAMSRQTLRVAFTGVSHWHAPMYYIPAARSAGVNIVAITDPDARVVESVSRDLGAKGFTDYREMINSVRPELVFAFGRHCDMPDIANALIDEKVPFIIEKPGGLNSAQVSAFRDRAKAKNVYAGCGFNFRVSDLYKKIQSLIGDDPVTHASFRYIAGGPYRYREANCAWMLDPKLSSGGSTINLSVHFIDLFRLFSKSQPNEVASLMGNFTWHLPIEDYSSMIIRSPSSICTVETGYTYPSEHGVFDLRFSIRTTRHYIVVRNDNVLEVHRNSDSHMEQYSIETSNMYMYPPFVTESVDRFVKGDPPLANLDDLVEVMKVVDAAYESSRGGGKTVKL